MNRKRLRLYLVLASMAVLGLAAFLVLRALDSELVYFLSPSEIAAKPPAAGQQIRIGGLVEAGSVDKSGGEGVIVFTVTDLASQVAVSYRGILPDLFREGQGVVVQGAFDEAGRFVAAEVLAKHDETYMPPEVAKALKESGRWQETEGQGDAQVTQ
ncbi:MAG: cytochrome c maturation protein CcmE [Rhodospirillaceae bacterium]|jgi:cytochrome c-type biogenesis protein CcmE|nr:cytochrome c maturation protein CcmE [Rhodospirillaceae bacterium]